MNDNDLPKASESPAIHQESYPAQTGPSPEQSDGQPQASRASPPQSQAPVRHPRDLNSHGLPGCNERDRMAELWLQEYERLDAEDQRYVEAVNGGAKLVHLTLCGTRCWGVVPVVHRRDPRCFE